jgi:4'-phosphopantetheinyl transferase EntD
MQAPRRVATSACRATHLVNKNLHTDTAHIASAIIPKFRASLSHIPQRLNSGKPFHYRRRRPRRLVGIFARGHGFPLFPGRFFAALIWRVELMLSRMFAVALMAKLGGCSPPVRAVTAREPQWPVRVFLSRNLRG